MRSKASLGSSREVEHGFGVSFVNCLYLVLLIIGQNFCATCGNLNQTGPRSRTGSARVRRGYQGRSKNRMAARAFPRRLVRTQPRVQRCAGAGA